MSTYWSAVRGRRPATPWHAATPRCLAGGQPPAPYPPGIGSASTRSQEAALRYLITATNPPQRGRVPRTRSVTWTTNQSIRTTAVTPRTTRCTSGFSPSEIGSPRGSSLGRPIPKGRATVPSSMRPSVVDQGNEHHERPAAARAYHRTHASRTRRHLVQGLRLVVPAVRDVPLQQPLKPKEAGVLTGARFCVPNLLDVASFGGWPWHMSTVTSPVKAGSVRPYGRIGGALRL